MYRSAEQVTIFEVDYNGHNPYTIPKCAGILNKTLSYPFLGNTVQNFKVQSYPVEISTYAYLLCILNLILVTLRMIFRCPF
jgi:hypothetical protein